jgi:hypothetical protein
MTGMTGVIACVVCARPFDSLLTSGLQAGVLVLALVAVAVLGAIARGAVRLLREDADESTTAADARGPS